MIMPEPAIESDVYAGLSPQEIDDYLRAIKFSEPVRGPYNRRWWIDDKGQCNLRQRAMLSYGGKHGLFGGRPGGGKSAYLLMRACQFLHKPGYSALLLRRTWPQLSKPGGLIDMAHEWLSPWRDCWNEQKRIWRMPGGGSLQFGHCENEKDKYNYQGDEYSFIGFDELTQFTETIYDFICTRLRRRSNVDVPLHVRAASNPGGEGHEFVKKMFITEGDQDHLFFPSSLEDNPFLDRVSYQKQLEEIQDPVLRRQLLEGDWDVQARGDVLSGDWFEVVSDFKIPDFQVRSWDVAGTVRRKDGRISDETVGTLWWKDQTAGKFCIASQMAFRATPGDVEDKISETMDLDEAQRRTLTIEEKPPGEAGAERAEKRTKRFAGHLYYCGNAPGIAQNKSKEERAYAMSIAAQHGLIKLLAERPGQEKWIREFKSQCNTYGQPHILCDRPDGASLGFNTIAWRQPSTVVRSGVCMPGSGSMAALLKGSLLASLGRGKRR